MIKRATIIGSNGYIGRNLAFFLQSKSIALYCYDIQENSLVSGVEYISVDITKKDQVSSIKTDVDSIFMFAGLTGTDQSFSKYENYIDVNIKGLLNILDHMKNSHSIARLVFPSTRLIYKGIKNIALDEEAEKESRTIYAATKIAGENLLKTYHEIFNLDYTIFRICVPYGDLVLGDNSYGTIGFFMKKARSGENIVLYGDGEQKRTFSHVSKICSVMYDSVSMSETKNETYNIGGESFSLKEIACLIAQKYHVEIEYIPWPEFALKIESGDTIFNDSKIKKLIDDQNEIKMKYWLM